MQVDVEQLSRRSEGTQWDWKAVESWLDLGDGGGKALCVLAGAGTGKSTISAAILTKVGSTFLALPLEALSALPPHFPARS